MPTATPQPNKHHHNPGPSQQAQSNPGVMNRKPTVDRQPLVISLEPLELQPTVSTINQQPVPQPPYSSTSQAPSHCNSSGSCSSPQPAGSVISRQLSHGGSFCLPTPTSMPTLPSTFGDQNMSSQEGFTQLDRFT